MKNYQVSATVVFFLFFISFFNQAHNFFILGMIIWSWCFRMTHNFWTNKASPLKVLGKYMPKLWDTLPSFTGQAHNIPIISNFFPGLLLHSLLNFVFEQIKLIPDQYLQSPRRSLLICLIKPRCHPIDLRLSCHITDENNNICIYRCKGWYFYNVWEK